MSHYRPLFFIFVFYRLKMQVQLKLPMTGFEPRSSAIISNRAVNCATTTASIWWFNRHFSRYKYKNIFNGPIPASFYVLFSSFSHYSFNHPNWKKHKRCAWDLNPWLQDGMQRQNHGAMAVFLLFGISFKRFVAAAISRF